MRGLVVITCSLLIGACQREPDPPPPPIQGGPSGGPVIPPNPTASVDTGTTSATASTTGGTADTTGMATDGGVSGPETGGPNPLISGHILDGPAGVVPMTCMIRLHTFESLDPGSGLPIDIAYEAVSTVQDLPQFYAINVVPDGIVGEGDDVYVSTRCDVDGDGALDDVGAYYPQVPLETVLLPAQDIDLVLDNVF